MKTPNKLYHAAPECAYEGIDEHGLQANFGEVYAGGSIAEAMTFMWFRLIDHAHNEWVDGKLKFEMIAHDEVHIWEIDTTITGKNNWSGGTDHNAAFFGKARSFTHTGDIERAALVQCHIVTREEVLERIEGAKNA